MFSLAQRLKINHWVRIITDNPKDRMEHHRTYQSLDSLFYPLVVSADIEKSKYSQEIFLHATLGVRVDAIESCVLACQCARSNQRADRN
jgi:beta-phosphoglucomutase-like phosphatase (HAD superfamily)